MIELAGPMPAIWLLAIRGGKSTTFIGDGSFDAGTKGK